MPKTFTLALVLLSAAYTAPAFAQVAAATTTPSTSAAPNATPNTGSATQPEPDKIHLEVPAATSPIPRSYHVHRGFYLGAAGGIGYNSGTYDDNDPSGRDLEADGFNLSLDLLVGGSPSPGLALGGALLSDVLTSASFRRNGFTETDSSSMSHLFGVFVDGFPNPEGAFHVGGALGLSHVAAKNVTFNDKSLSIFGVGYAAWVGYTPWVSDHFSMGGELRYMSVFSGIGADRSAATHSINLLFDAIYF